MFHRVKDAAKDLNLSERFLRKLIAEQRIPYYRLSKRTIRVDLNELREHMRSVAEGTLQTEPEAGSDG
jgi:excisionase family DNA binding protein